MKIIAIANSKGGVGKTTITCNLAVALATGTFISRPPATVLVVDADPQKSAENFFVDRADRVGAHDVTVTVKTNPKGLAREIKSMAERYDYVICDVGGSRDSEIMRQVLLASQFVIAPTRSSQPDLDGLNQFLSVVDEIKGVNDKLETFVLINQAPTDAFDTLTPTVKAGLTEALAEDATVLTTVIRRYKAWEKLSDGYAIFELPTGGKADQDFTAFTFELTERGVI